MTKDFLFCDESVTEKSGHEHLCPWKAKYIVKRRDGDRRRVCGTHRNQLLRYGWKLVDNV